MSLTLRAAEPCKSAVLPICPAIPAGMTGLQHLCITARAPAWEPLSCKLMLGRSSGSWSFKNPIPKRELGNEQTTRVGKTDSVFKTESVLP